ncbi:MAG: hypothetical protein ACOYKJ_02775 [Candidatus Howiella sp.]
MKKEEYWAAFVKTGEVKQYLAYKNCLNSPAGREEKEHASVHRRDHRAGEYRF